MTGKTCWALAHLALLVAYVFSWCFWVRCFLHLADVAPHWLVRGFHASWRVGAWSNLDKLFLLVTDLFLKVGRDVLLLADEFFWLVSAMFCWPTSLSQSMCFGLVKCHVMPLEHDFCITELTLMKSSTIVRTLWCNNLTFVHSSV